MPFSSYGIEWIFQFMNLIGIVTFSFDGALKGIREGLDLLGVATLGVVTSLGGGMLRDIIVGRMPNALVLYKKLRKPLENQYTFLILDTIGISAFTVTGALLAYKAGASFYGVILLATITGVGGGAIADVLLRRIPWILKEDFYATCSIIGATVFYVSMKLSHNVTLSSFACLGSIFVMRLLAIVYCLRLPRFVN